MKLFLPAPGTTLGPLAWEQGSPEGRWATVALLLVIRERKHLPQERNNRGTPSSVPSRALSANFSVGN